MQHFPDPTPVDRVLGDRYGAQPVEPPTFPTPLPAWRYEVFNVLKTFIWFSIIPVNRPMNAVIPNTHNPSYEIQAEQYLWLPMIGIACVSTIFGLGYFMAWCGVPLFIAALIAGYSYHLMYGHIHLEGLSDTVDALHAFPRKDPLTVLTEPHTGALGARYSGTANNLTSLLLACLVYLDVKHESFLGVLGAVMVVAAVRVMPMWAVLALYDDYHPGGSASIGACTIDIKQRLRNFATITVLSMSLPAFGVSLFYMDPRGFAFSAVAVTAYGVSVLTVKKITFYLRLIYGDVLGCAIVVGEIAGLGILTMILGRWV